ncbi:MAG: ArdC family protein, partial [Firmicutes bacterium]|nr:ArdC family protein [Bacillota bacterium]
MTATETTQELLEQAYADLTSGAVEAWRRWARTYAHFHTYSIGNQLLIAAQNPEATTVAGFKAWRALGRSVNKGAHGIMIIAPLIRRPADSADRFDAPVAPKDPAETRQLTGFRVVYVFDV